MVFGRPMFDSTLNACPSSNIHSFLLPGSIPEINFPLLLLSLLFLCFLLLLSSSPSALYCVTRLHVSGTTLQGAEWVDAKGLYNNMNSNKYIYIYIIASWKCPRIRLTLLLQCTVYCVLLWVFAGPSTFVSDI